jgi:hypothetical protein
MSNLTRRAVEERNDYVRMRCAERMAFSDIALEMGLSRERVRQMAKKLGIVGNSYRRVTTLRSAPPTVTRCARCGKEFRHSGKPRKFCSVGCRLPGRGRTFCLWCKRDDSAKNMVKGGRQQNGRIRYIHSECARMRNRVTSERRPVHKVT